MKVKLHVFKENGDRKEVPVKPGKHVIGRGEDASIRVPLASVSRRHCEIEVTEDAVLVCPRDRAQEVKAIVAQLENEAPDEL